MNSCKNICEKLTTKPITIGYNRLGIGWKKCRCCDISIMTDKFRCPCCNSKLSSRKIHNYEKRRLVA